MSGLFNPFTFIGVMFMTGIALFMIGVGWVALRSQLHENKKAEKRQTSSSNTATAATNGHHKSGRHHIAHEFGVPCLVPLFSPLSAFIFLVLVCTFSTVGMSIYFARLTTIQNITVLTGPNTTSTVQIHVISSNDPYFSQLGYGSELIIWIISRAFFILYMMLYWGIHWVHENRLFFASSWILLFVSFIIAGISMILQWLSYAWTTLSYYNQASFWIPAVSETSWFLFVAVIFVWISLISCWLPSARFSKGSSSSKIEDTLYE